MSVTPTRVRELALALENAAEVAHFDRAAFRTPRRIFATMGADGVNFMFDAALQDFYCEQAPAAFAPVAGGWGKMGATHCDLGAVDAATFLSALKAAHARANAPLPKKTQKRSKKKSAGKR
ncbi:MmcQ/YjbR family DNA-binding protein [Terricaulis sp.]|uniref:MmcQ/YjbR family DNA-binding protein n=1 Tax=Terricaulis sp. TaxID=2768686 RepID=UPI0037844639